MLKHLVLALLVASCGARSPALPSGSARITDEIALYRDRALVKHRIDVVVPEASIATVSYVVPEGVSLGDVALVDTGVLNISEVRTPQRDPVAQTPSDNEREEEHGQLDLDEGLAEDGDGDGGDDGDVREPAPQTPTTVTFTVTAPQAGRYSLAIAYVTNRVSWEAAYTMTTTPARTRATLRGAIAIRNKLEAPLPAARVYVVDSELGAWRGNLGDASANANTTPVAAPRLVGDVVLAKGETRLELLPSEPPRQMRSVLVYDPIGTKLDNSGARPLIDATLGTERASPHVTESFEIARPTASSDGLPAGPVRLLERRADGSLAVLGESRLFDAATRVAAVDTIALGIADGVTGWRERREITYDEDNRRVVEEFVLAIKNTRAYPVEVVLREHLYRGQNWTLAYQTASAPTKEGPQQISMRMIAPARGEGKVLYVVVYTGL